MLYLTNVILENIGPIEKLELEFPFNENGQPVPVVLVGKNGAGKTILLSYIVDALFEFAVQAYRDVLPADGQARAYFKVTGPTNLRMPAAYGLAYLNFRDGDKTIQYFEKFGRLTTEQAKEKTKNKLNLPISWVDNSNQKISTQDNLYFKEQFSSNSFCFFPANRFEIPHWLNRSYSEVPPLFSFQEKFTDILAKPIVVSTSLDLTRQWVMNLVLDYHLYGDSTLWNEVNRLLKAIVLNPNARFGIGPRVDQHRLAAGEQDEKGTWIRTFAPSLNHLSAGQATLLSLFCTIIRYADKGSNTKLDNVEGLVLIDEADLHLHTSVLKDVLPRLIKLFPRVQFILTTHSPVFLLGMREIFGEAGYAIYQMPGAEKIYVEQFSEFAQAYSSFKNTSVFTDEIRQLTSVGSKPIVFVEGETDELYIKKAMAIFGISDLLEKIDIKFIGSKGPDGVIGSGKDALNAAYKFLTTNPHVVNRKVVLLYDADANKRNQEAGNVLIRTYQANSANTRVKRGIENLFPERLFEKKFYISKEHTTEYGESKIIEQFQKTAFCDFLCNERKVSSEEEKSDFTNFVQILDLLKELLPNSPTQNTYH